MTEREIKSRLLQEYAAAAKHYSWAVNELNRQRATLPIDDYLKMRKMVEDARRECERVRTELRGFGP